MCLDLQLDMFGKVQDSHKNILNLNCLQKCFYNINQNHFWNYLACLLDS